MRNIIIIMVLLLTGSLLVHTQEIVDNEKLWSILTGHCQPEYTTYTTSFLKFDNDTIIDGKLYQMVFISEDEFHEEWFFYGSFVREENKKVYYREYYGEEGLIYDFNLQLGDTVVLNNPRAASEVTLTLAEIDSVETTDGYRERWKLTNDEFEIPEYWIEGIGSMAGVINSTTEIFGGLCGTYILLCEEENENTVYQNPQYESCYYLLLNGGSNIKSEETFNVIYRQSIKQIDIAFNTSEERLVMITNIKGQLLSKIQTIDAHLSFLLSGKNTGLYIINVLQNNSKLVSKKIMVY